MLNIERSGYASSGFADRYDAYRPEPPDILLDVVLQLAQTAHPDLVIDLGSGTGISTCVWADRARQVVGIEPNNEMRRRAGARSKAPNVSFQAGFAHQTGVPEGAADIVTCAQSLHWMEPESTFAEVARILRSGGVFAAYDYDWPPAVHWEAERAFSEFMGRVREMRRRHGIEGRMQQWAKNEHLVRMQDSGRFRYVRETLIHSLERCTIERLIGFTLTLGHVSQLLELGLSEAELGVDELRREFERTLGNGSMPWYWSYRLRVGVT
jgi:ubiquinone/menaquinone biosynthesis C-methylase UbiE